MKEYRSVGAVIFRVDEGTAVYLLLKSGKGYWGFAKGHVEKGESDEETMRREVVEEAGITDLKLLPNFKEEISYLYKENGVLVKKTAAYFLAQTLQTEVKLSFEHDSFAWLAFNAAIELITHKNDREILEKAVTVVADNNRR